MQPEGEAAPNLAEIFARIGRRSRAQEAQGRRHGGVSPEWHRESVEEEAQVYARPLDPSILQQMPASSKTFYERGFLERLKENVMEVIKKG